MKSALWLLIGLAGCGDAPLSTALTTGVAVDVEGCPFRITTPNETTEPVHDDGKLGTAPTPRAQHLTFVGDPSTTISAVWETDFATTGTTLEYGADTSYGTKVKGFSVAYPTDLAGEDAPSVRVHQAHACGLKPATTYHYRVGSGAQVSADATFTTGPADASPVRLLVIGDSRDSVSVWNQALTMGAADAPDLIVYTGDAVILGTIQDAWDAWFDAAKAVLPGIPMMSLLGNHEANARHYYAQFPGPGNQQWYSFDYGDLHVTALNDTPLDPTTISADQKQFLDADLGKSNKTFKIVSHHKPVYTSYEGADILGHMHESELEMSWVPLEQSHQVDLVMNGHVHGFERTFPLQNGAPVADGQGPVYVTFGGAGASLVDLVPKPFIAKQLSTYGYVLVDIAGRTLTVTAKALDGTVLDQYTITK